MANRIPLSRRDSLKTIAAGSALLGGGALGMSAVMGDDETEDDGGDADDSESLEIDPEAIQLVAQCVDDGGEFATFRVDNDNDESVRLTAEGTPVIDYDGDTDNGDAGNGDENSDTDDGDTDNGDAGNADGDDEEAIERINEIVEGVNERLENVDGVDTIDEIDEDTADEVQDDIFTQVVAEINAQSQEILGEDIADDVDTPEEAREEADEIEAEYGAAAQEAVDGLNDAADSVEEIQQLAGGGNGNDADDGLTVGATDSATITTELDPDDTATVTLYLEDEEVAKASTDYHEMETRC